MAEIPQAIEARVRSLAQDVVGRSGYELVDVEYRREPGGWTLRLVIDKHGGVTLDDCQNLSQEFGTVLEVEDPIPHQFRLEISSPGLDRPLKNERDYLGAQGKLIRLTLREPLAGQRNFKGRLLDAGSPRQETTRVTDVPSNGMTLRLLDGEGRERLIPAAAVERARLVYEWPQRGAKRSSKR